MNSGQDDGGTLEGFYAYKDTFDPDNVWVEVPKASQALDLGLEGVISLKVCSNFRTRSGSFRSIVKSRTRRRRCESNVRHS